MSKKVKIEVVRGVEGNCVCVSDLDGSGHRLAGPKPWGGGSTVHSFEVDLDELVREATALAYEKTP